MSKSGLFFIGIYGPCVIFTHPNLQRYYTLNIHMIFHPPAWMLKNRRLQEREAPRYVAKKKKYRYMEKQNDMEVDAGFWVDLSWAIERDLSSPHPQKCPKWWIPAHFSQLNCYNVPRICCFSFELMYLNFRLTCIIFPTIDIISRFKHCTNIYIYTHMYQYVKDKQAAIMALATATTTTTRRRRRRQRRRRRRRTRTRQGDMTTTTRQSARNQQPCETWTTKT